MLNPASREPLNVHFNNVSVRDILNVIAQSDRHQHQLRSRRPAIAPTTVQLDGVTLEQALNQIMTMNELSYKVVSERSIFVFQDTPPKHAQYDDQVVRTFYLSHADATEMTQMLSTIIRLPGIAVQPAIAPNKTATRITVRGTTSVVQIIEKIIEQNDKPRAEIVVDVEILEVDRTRAKSYGLNLSRIRARRRCSRRKCRPARHDGDHRARAPGPGRRTGTGTGTTTTATGTSTAPSALSSPPPFNLNTISRGVTHRRLLSGGADGDRALPRVGHHRRSSSRSRSCAARKAAR